MARVSPRPPRGRAGDARFSLVTGRSSAQHRRPRCPTHSGRRPADTDRPLFRAKLTAEITSADNRGLMLDHRVVDLARRIVSIVAPKQIPNACVAKNFRSQNEPFCRTLSKGCSKRTRESRFGWAWRGKGCSAGRNAQSAEIRGDHAYRRASEKGRGTPQPRGSAKNRRHPSARL
jgi:hypothetical protein